MRVMRERSSVTPPRTGVTWPSSDVPAPQATTGTWLVLQSASRRAASSVVSTKATASGRTGGWVSWPCEWCSRSVALVVMRSPRKSRAVAITVSAGVGMAGSLGFSSGPLRLVGKRWQGTRIGLDDQRLGKLEFRGAAAAAIGANGSHELQILPIDAEAAGTIARRHNDPFDRMLVAQARRLTVPLGDGGFGHPRLPARLADSGGLTAIRFGLGASYDTSPASRRRSFGLAYTTPCRPILPSCQRPGAGRVRLRQPSCAAAGPHTRWAARSRLRRPRRRWNGPSRRRPRFPSPGSGPT